MKRAISGAMVAVGLAAPAQADLGDYLAARSAAAAHDFEIAARHYMAMIDGGITSHGIYENALTAHLGAGDLDGALAIAMMMEGAGFPSQIGALVRQAEAARVGDWDAVIEALDTGDSIGPLVDGLARAWAELGRGDVDAALAAFDAVIATEGLRPFGLYHKALALAVVGDFEGALAIFELPASEGMPRTRRSVMAEAQVLAQLGRPADALDLLDRAFGGRSDPAIDHLRASLGQDTAPPFALITSPLDGLAEVYLTIGRAIEGEVSDAYTLFYARAAAETRPTLTEAHLMTARLLQALGRHDLANAAYDAVAPEDPAFAAAEIERARALGQAGRPDAAIEVLTQLTASHPRLGNAEAELGHALSRDGRMTEAEAAFGRAIALTPETDPRLWRLYFARAVARHGQDNWDGAETDLRRALDFSPDEPVVLNYLGYGLVERGETLDDALAMIERAVAQEPQNAAMIDSLGWALFRLGEFQRAVAQLEKAAALEPTSPVINDHLGDAYWAVGRRTEARFQWTRAMSFTARDDTAELDRLRDKLDHGLEIALGPDGEAVLTIAEDRP